MKRIILVACTIAISISCTKLGPGITNTENDIIKGDWGWCYERSTHCEYEEEELVKKTEIYYGEGNFVFSNFLLSIDDEGMLSMGWLKEELWFRLKLDSYGILYTSLDNISYGKPFAKVSTMYEAVLNFFYDENQGATIIQDRENNSFKITENGDETIYTIIPINSSLYGIRMKERFSDGEEECWAYLKRITKFVG